MAAGRVITDHVPADAQAQDPFVRHIGVGEKAHLEYGEVKVYAVRAADFLVGIDPIAARGTFLVVDVEARGRHRSSTFKGPEVRAADGTTYGPTMRGTQCASVAELATGATTYTRFCFDMPVSALAGSHLLLDREGSWIKGEVARTEIVDVDLGISAAEARSMGRERITLDGDNTDDLVKPEQSVLPEPSGAPEEKS
jgi:hypothetical protein